jgi:hypothetical protein
MLSRVLTISFLTLTLPMSLIEKKEQHRNNVDSMAVSARSYSVENVAQHKLGAWATFYPIPDTRSIGSDGCPWVCGTLIFKVDRKLYSNDEFHGLVISATGSNS